MQVSNALLAVFLSERVGRVPLKSYFCGATPCRGRGAKILGDGRGGSEATGCSRGGDTWVAKAHAGGGGSGGGVRGLPRSITTASTRARAGLAGSGRPESDSGAA